MKFGKTGVLILIILSFFGGLFYFQIKQEEKYEGLAIIPERTEDIPLYSELKPASPIYRAEGDQWEEIKQFYEKELPNNGWRLIMSQSSATNTEDGAGFTSFWKKDNTSWVLSISAAYYKNLNQTEVVFDKREGLRADRWIEMEVSEICINEQPDRSDECFKMKDKQVIGQVISMINGALEADRQQVYYTGKSVIDFGSLKVDVYYDLEEGIYFVSDRGAKWMKPEKEFFELTKISKEY